MINLRTRLIRFGLAYFAFVETTTAKSLAATNALEAYRPRTAKFDAFVGQPKKKLDEVMGLKRFFGRNPLSRRNPALRKHFMADKPGTPK